ncbi:MAG: hypothetical protein WCF22_01665 [Candidatus Sulfotelmatobacter sp.]
MRKKLTSKVLSNTSLLQDNRRPTVCSMRKLPQTLAEHDQKLLGEMTADGKPLP